MTETQQPPYARRELVRELGLLRERGIVRVESPTHTPRDFQILKDLARLCAGSKKSVVTALEELIRTAIDRLPDGLLKTAANMIYGFHGDFTDAKPDVWRAEASKLFNIKSLDDFKKREEAQILTLIAAEIEILAVPRLAIKSQQQAPRLPLVGPTFTTRYIDRPSDNGRFALATVAACLRDSRLFVVGDAGTGKTRFVTERLSISPDASRSIWLKAATDDELCRSIAPHLDSAGVQISGSGSTALKYDFAHYLREQTDRETFVIVDDVANPDRINELIPSGIPAFVITISRIHPSDKSWPCVHIDDMGSDEATAMVQSLRPDAQEAEARRLAMSLGYRPRLIEDACRFLGSNPDVRIDDLSRLLATDLPEAIDDINDLRRPASALTVTYRRLVRHLTEDHPDSLRLLELLAFASPYITKEYIGAYLLNKPYLTAADNLRAAMKIRAALRPLTEQCIVRDGVGLVMTPVLVQAILRDILGDRLKAVVEATSRIKASREELYREGWSVTTVAGRVLCESILKARIKDQQADNKLRLQGDLGGARWERLIERTWFRALSLEWSVAHFVIHQPNGDAILPENHEAARIAARDAPSLIREDVELTVVLGKLIASEAAEQGIDLSAPAGEILAAIPEEDRRGQDSLSKRSTPQMANSTLAFYCRILSMKITLSPLLLRRSQYSKSRKSTLTKIAVYVKL